MAGRETEKMKWRLPPVKYLDSHLQDELGKDYTQGEGKLGIWLPECRESRNQG